MVVGQWSARWCKTRPRRDQRWCGAWRGRWTARCWAARQRGWPRARPWRGPWRGFPRCGRTRRRRHGAPRLRIRQSVAPHRHPLLSPVPQEGPHRTQSPALAARRTFRTSPGVPRSRSRTCTRCTSSAAGGPPAEAGAAGAAVAVRPHHAPRARLRDSLLSSSSGCRHPTCGCSRPGRPLHRCTPRPAPPPPVPSAPAPPTARAPLGP